MSHPFQNRADFALLLLTVFLCGMIVLVLEVLGSRVLGPYFGISLFIWTSLITITLISLSLGYTAGGFLSDRYQSRDLFYSLILGAGLSIMFIPMIQKPVSLAMTSLGPRLGCLATAFVLFTLPLTLLGMVAPFSLKLSLNELRRAGKISGNLYALSTLGGILGTLLVGFWMIPNLGLKNIFLMTSILLSVLSGSYFLMKKKWVLSCLSLLLIGTNLAMIVYPSDGSLHSEIIYKSQSYYGELKVLRKEALHMLMVDGAIQTAYQYETRQSKAPYTRLIEEIIQTDRNKSERKSFHGAVIGLGGGIIPEAEYKMGDAVDIVEIDPRIPEVAQAYFQFHPERFRLVLEDARHFLNENREKYHYLVLDVFAGESSPFYLLSRECFEQIKRSLTEDGILVINSIGLFSGEGSDFTASINRTLHHTFPHQALFTTSLKDNFSNYIFVASTKPLEYLTSDSEILNRQELHLTDRTGILLTDNYNPADYLEQETALRWRIAIWNSTSAGILLD
ncbi:MAG: fused MFS/spermidine synthase [Nitrospirae bacterium]|nr:fused MFS/spermidine synthase [Nitrospirota bacterium]MBI3593988.1 fused MFS/spermidine synthase [Nitrospirota bacterium]